MITEYKNILTTEDTKYIGENKVQDSKGRFYEDGISQLNEEPTKELFLCKSYPCEKPLKNKRHQQTTNNNKQKPTMKNVLSLVVPLFFLILTPTESLDMAGNPCN